MQLGEKASKGRKEKGRNGGKGRQIHSFIHGAEAHARPGLGFFMYEKPLFFRKSAQEGGPAGSLQIPLFSSDKGYPQINTHVYTNIPVCTRILFKQLF